MKPLLSICIPTYNRASYLKDSIESIVSQSGFDDRTEIIISDNNSDDDTEIVGREYATKYENIKYYRNPPDNCDWLVNFRKTIERGTGALRKLSNDYLIYADGSLEYMLNLTEKSIGENKPYVFFLNGYNASMPELKLDDFDAFIRDTYYWPTWIAMITVWDEDMNKISLFDNDSLFPHDVFLFELLKSKPVLVCNKNIMHVAYLNNRVIRYNYVNSYYDEYPSLLNDAIKDGNVRADTYKFLREFILYNFLPGMLHATMHNNDIIPINQDIESEMIARMQKDNRADRLPIPTFDFSNKGQLKNQRIVLYAAGSVGQSYMAQNRKIKLFTCVAWVDINYSDYGYLDEDIKPVQSIEEVPENEFDYILISINNSQTSETVRNQLISNYGINYNKILWQQPLRLY